MPQPYGAGPGQYLPTQAFGPTMQQSITPESKTSVFGAILSTIPAVAQVAGGIADVYRGNKERQYQSEQLDAQNRHADTVNNDDPYGNISILQEFYDKYRKSSIPSIASDATRSFGNVKDAGVNEFQYGQRLKEQQDNEIKRQQKADFDAAAEQHKHQFNLQSELIQQSIALNTTGSLQQAFGAIRQLKKVYSNDPEFLSKVVALETQAIKNQQEMQNTQLAVAKANDAKATSEAKELGKGVSSILEGESKLGGSIYTAISQNKDPIPVIDSILMTAGRSLSLDADQLDEYGLPIGDDRIRAEFAKARQEAIYKAQSAVTEAVLQDNSSALSAQLVNPAADVGATIAALVQTHRTLHPSNFRTTAATAIDNSLEFIAAEVSSGRIPVAVGLDQAARLVKGASEQALPIGYQADTAVTAIQQVATNLFKAYMTKYQEENPLNDLSAPNNDSEYSQADALATGWLLSSGIVDTPDAPFDDGVRTLKDFITVYGPSMSAAEIEVFNTVKAAVEPHNRAAKSGVDKMQTFVAAVYGAQASVEELDKVDPLVQAPVNGILATIPLSPIRNADGTIIPPNKLEQILRDPSPAGDTAKAQYYSQLWDLHRRAYQGQTSVKTAKNIMEKLTSNDRNEILQGITGLSVFGGFANPMFRNALGDKWADSKTGAILLVLDSMVDHEGRFMVDWSPGQDPIKAVQSVLNSADFNDDTDWEKRFKHVINAGIPGLNDKINMSRSEQKTLTDLYGIGVLLVGEKRAGTWVAKRLALSGTKIVQDTDQSFRLLHDPTDVAYDTPEEADDAVRKFVSTKFVRLKGDAPNAISPMEQQFADAFNNGVIIKNAEAPWDYIRESIRAADPTGTMSESDRIPELFDFRLDYDNTLTPYLYPEPRSLQDALSGNGGVLGVRLKTSSEWLTIKTNSGTGSYLRLPKRYLNRYKSVDALPSQMLNRLPTPAPYQYGF